MLPRACLNAVPPQTPTIDFTKVNDLNGGLPIVAGFIFRQGGGLWDAGIDAGGNYNPSDLVPSLGGSWPTQDTQTNPTSDANVRFILTFTVGVGYTWELDNNNNPATVSFVTKNGLQGAINSAKVRATDYHNAIMIVARSEQTGKQARIDTLQFTFLDNSGLTPCGSLVDLVRTGNSDSLGREWIVSDSDLSQTSWKLTGRMRLTAVGSSLNENVQIAIYTVPLVNKVFTTCNGCEACPAV